MSHEFVYETGIRKVPRRTWWLPHWAWHVYCYRPEGEQRQTVWRLSGYTRTWLGAVVRVGRRTTNRKGMRS